jgi:hypothetical protein
MLKFTKKFYCKVPTWEDILDNFNQSVLQQKIN